MSESPLPEDLPQTPVSQSNEGGGHNINVIGQGHSVAGRDLIQNIYTGPIEQLPIYSSTPAPKRVYIPHLPTTSTLRSNKYPIAVAVKQRAQLLDNMYSIWIEGILEKNLKAGDLRIEKDLKVDAVLTDADFRDYRLAPDASIGDVFHKMGGQILILGDPGSGKTIMLLQLLKDLLIDTCEDLTEIPVLLNLSSWAAEQKPLEAWLADEMLRVYGVPRKQSRKWLQSERLILLLDGLDEVAEQIGQAHPRQACATAINCYREVYPAMQIVVCSRIVDYQMLQKKLKLNSAISLRPLTRKQIFDYLQGPAAEGVRDLITAEESAYEMVQTPLLLNIMKMSYANISYREGPVQKLKLENATKDDRRDHLFELYVNKQTKNSDDYSKKNTYQYLQWLARHMIDHNISIFYIEDLQFSMLLTARNIKRIFILRSGYILGLIFGSIGIVSGLAFGLTMSSLAKPPVLASLILSVIFGGILGIVGCALGLIYGCLRVISGGLNERIKLAERIHFTWNSVAVIFGLIGAIIGWAYWGMLGAASFGCLGVLMYAIKVSENVLGRQEPGSGIRKSWINISLVSTMALVTTPVFGPTTLMTLEKVTNQGLSLTQGLLSISIIVLTFILVFGLIVSLFFAQGTELIRHNILRSLLSQEGNIPPIHYLSITGRYDRFLDHAADISLLRKVGGGYIFRHRMLMEYLAEQYKKSLEAK
jgi:hypothetical protein